MDEMNGKKNSQGYDEETFGSLQQAFGYEGSKDNEMFRDDSGADIMENVKEQTGETEGYGSQKKEEKTIYTSEWTPDYTVPGADSYSYSSEPEKKQSRALEICALIVGILSIVGCCFYGIFGVIGLVLSIIALAKGHKSGVSVAALLCSVFGLILSVVLIVFSVAQFGELSQKTIYENVDDTYENVDEGVDVDDNTEEFNNDIVEEMDDYLDITDDTQKNPISNEEAGGITIDGNTFSVPCKLSELLAIYEISEYSLEDMESELEPDKTTYLALAKDGKRKGINVSIINDTDEVMTDFSDATVYCIDITSDDESPVFEAVSLKGIAMGMATAEVEEALDGLDYDVDTYDDYTFYTIEAGENEDYSINFMLQNDKVICIDVAYYGD